MSVDYSNSTAVEHLIFLSKTVNGKGTEYHQSIIKGIGEAGGVHAVEHLVHLSKTVNGKGSLYHQVIITALGRAGRIS